MELKIRSLDKRDYNAVRRIYEQYKNEMDFPDFVTNYLFSFAICDNDDNIITAAGVRTILEVVALTDKTRSVRERRQALLDVLEASSFVADGHGYKQLHAFVQGEKWTNQLIKAGNFHLIRGTGLVHEVTKDG